jgi:hypothetical protein
MWIKQSLKSGKPVLIDLSKVTDIQEHQDGVRVWFNMLAPNKDGRNVPKSITVRQSVEELTRLLKAKSA